MTKTAAAAREPEAEASPTPTKAKPSSFNMVWYLVPVLLAIAAGLYSLPLETTDDAIVFSKSPRQLAVNMSAPLPEKYRSDIVRIQTRKLLTPDPACVPPMAPTDRVHVTSYLGRPETLRAQKSVLFLLNGENDGVVLPWDVADGCLHALTASAAFALGVDADYAANGLRLHNSDGQPIDTASELDRDRIVYILTDFQLWVWPGVEVGYERTVDGVKLKTLSLAPLVFGVEDFFTSDETEYAIELGLEHLKRSPVDSKEAPDGYHADRTSFTAFLDDSHYTRDFRARTAALARLPSPVYCERMQLLRYQTGQFFRQHEDYFSSKDFLQQSATAVADYEAWATWAAATIDALPESVPVPFQQGHPLYPVVADTGRWQHALLQLFLDEAAATGYFATEHVSDVAWRDWIQENVQNKAVDILKQLLESKPYMLEGIIASWEKHIGLPALHYKAPKHPPSGVSHYFRWIRWAKERVEQVGEDAPVVVRTYGRDYPTYRMQFQTKMIQYVLEDYTPDDIDAALGAPNMAAWLEENKDATDALLDILRRAPAMFDLVVASWTKRAGDAFVYTKPVQFQHFEPNRFVTLFLYLNDVPEGGETVFPYSKERLVTDIERDGMAECSEGLAVPAKRLKAAFFYDQTGQNILDPLSLHGGCPPARGTKFGANLFTWNADADEGSNAWGFGG
ncbi:hypothetical protein SPRG_11628 [Saprolegnia parasitica CBS 223.65]|uniref:Prolyl 4-hydroxylase alpha subunit domain-containing protein n=1 Tax=Saprolegnia parasitica (strain CBS 223.65) TaxID=695850 RepID=A0A067BXR7_SAPPC|nr:hypothetical protein SPRG_11628 [Saprolegnia parasitica CBS 223.65]KDO23314.1 hypothetical protein SPRG_11628 [Saprolegnia parasitica CBS 223.65]|eukprot:XP_012205966.1 hypothetical protein SPRG_11628 [Saprolegnia parasitica CBS 223.65]